MPRAPLPFYRLAWGFYLALAVAGVIGWGAQRGPLGLAAFVEPGTWWLDLGLGLGLGGALVGVWEVLRRLARGPRRLEAELRQRLGALTRGEALALALVSAVGEEIAFRGALQSWLGWWPAALLFALAHVGPAGAFLWWTGWALVGGVGFGLVVEGRGALGAALVAHLVVNAVQLVRLSRPAGAPAAPPAGAPPG